MLHPRLQAQARPTPSALPGCPSGATGSRKETKGCPPPPGARGASPATTSGKRGIPARLLISLALLGWTAFVPLCAQDVVINEIMFHPLQPADGPEPVAEEYLELFNRGTNAVRLDGWELDRGVSFALSNVTLAARAHLVVAADLGAFSRRYPDITNVVGGWTGTLANNGEGLRLRDALGHTVAEVRYASEGDWAVRRRGPDDFRHRGWEWFAPADGLGLSLQLRQPSLETDHGQNWLAANPTPGRVNACWATRLAPLILDTAHSPVVPQPNQAVAITARLLAEPGAMVTAAVFFRVDALSPNSFVPTPMFDDGQHGDGVAGDGTYGALLPAQPDRTVVEFYVEATQETGLTNRWPPLPLPAPDQTNLPARTPNALYQVDDSPRISPQPLYKLILTESERAEIASIPCGPDQESNAEMNGTFISLDGTGTECRYQCGFRNRGGATRCADPPNWRVHFPNDQPWKGLHALNLNAFNPLSQIVGARLAQQAGLAGADAWAVQVRVNGVNAADPGGGMFGSYAALEDLGSVFAAHHFPLEPDGNLYRVNRDVPPSDFDYRGPDPHGYTNTYFKLSNASADDWTDLIGLLEVVGVNNPAPFTSSAARGVANLEQWMNYLAVLTLLGSGGTDPGHGYNDDYTLYRGTLDHRFQLLLHDLDSILGWDDFGWTGLGTNETIWGATEYPPSGDTGGLGLAFGRLLHWPDFEPLYYATLQRLLDSAFSETQFNALLDRTVADYPPSTLLAAAVSNMKRWMNGRRAFVQSLLTGHVPAPLPAPLALISGEPRSPTPFPSATLFVSGNGLTHYRYRLNDGDWSLEQPVTTPIQIFALPDRSTNVVWVVGRDTNGLYQSFDLASRSPTWVVHTNLPTIRLDKVLAHNGTALEHQGTYPDLIELCNEGNATVDLSGLGLSDQETGPSRFSFPVGTTLAAGGYLILYASDPDNTPGLHLGFALNQDGDAVYLRDRAARGGAVLDSVEFGLQAADLALGRVGTSGAWQLVQPVFGAPSQPLALGDPTALRINEWLALGVPPWAEDFVELHNADPRPVALGGLYLSDEPGGAPGRHRIAPLSFIGGGGFGCFLADGNPTAGASHLGFRLSAQAGQLSLSAPDLSFLDYVAYAPQTAGRSQGRCPDGGSQFVDLAQPTPGSANACPPPPAGPQLVNLVPVVQLWQYREDGADLGTGWRGVGYNDAFWLTGMAPFGKLRDSPTAHVPEPILTPLSTGVAITYYFRTHFTAGSTAAFASLQLSNLIDDGAVFYVNGTELVDRFNMRPGAVTASTTALTTVSDATWRGPIAVPTNLIHAGDNVLAVEVHQINRPSSDVFFCVRLDAVLPAAPSAEPGVVLNEVLAAHGTSAEGDPRAPDWVELYNPSTNTVDLADMSLSDTPTDPRRWIFPSPTLLPPQGFLVVPFLANTPPSPTNTGFGLAQSGDSVYLFASLRDGGSLRDAITFGLQAADFSLGRSPDGDPDWVLCSPTPGTTNVPATLGSPTGLKINEWMAAPDSGDDWFELFNPNPQPVALGGLWLSDDLGSADARMKSLLPALSFLGCGTGAFQCFRADNNPTAGADHVAFKLSGSDGDAIGLSRADGTLIHGIHFAPQQTGVSEGFLPDGTTNLVRFPGSASPGAANHLSPPRMFIRLDLPGGGVSLQFITDAGQTYTVLYRNSVTGVPWQKLADLPAQLAPQLVTLRDPSTPPASQRFYRLVTPSLP